MATRRKINRKIKKQRQDTQADAHKMPVAPDDGNTENGTQKLAHKRRLHHRKTKWIEQHQKNTRAKTGDSLYHSGKKSRTHGQYIQKHTLHLLSKKHGCPAEFRRAYSGHR